MSSSQEFVNMQCVTTQPMGFHVGCLEPNSQSLFNSLRTVHKSGDNVAGKVESAGLQLLENVKSRASATGNMSYGEMMNGMLLKDECLVSINHLEFISVSFYDESFKLMQTKPGGRLFLTDKRLLLISAQYHDNFKLSKFGDPKALPGGYEMELQCSDFIYYIPIPLRFFRSVEMKNQIGISGKVSIHAQAPPCNGWCGICGCLKDWLMTPLTMVEVKESDLTFGFLMPPWEKKSFIRLHLGENTHFSQVQGMVSIFQSVAPNLL